MWRRVALVRTDVSEEHVSSIFRVEKIHEQRNSCSQTANTFPRAKNFFYPEDGGDTFLRNVGSYKTYAAPHPRRRHSSFKSPMIASNGKYDIKVPQQQVIS
jgi:hypothetical protein